MTKIHNHVKVSPPHIDIRSSQVDLFSPGQNLVAVLKTHGYRTYDICEYDADEVHLAHPSMSICRLFEYQTTPPPGFLASPTTRGDTLSTKTLDPNRLDLR